MDALDLWTSRTFNFTITCGNAKRMYTSHMLHARSTNLLLMPTNFPRESEQASCFDLSLDILEAVEGSRLCWSRNAVILFRLGLATNFYGTTRVAGLHFCDCLCEARWIIRSARSLVFALAVSIDQIQSAPMREDSIVSDLKASRPIKAINFIFNTRG